MKTRTMLFGVLLVAPLAIGPPALAGDPPIDGLHGEVLHTPALVAPALAGDRLEHAAHALHFADFEAVAFGAPAAAGNPQPAASWPMHAGGMGMVHGMGRMQGAMPWTSAAPATVRAGHHLGSFWGRPIITSMLEQKQTLGLTPEQVNKLEALRSGFEQTTTAKIQEIGVRESDVHIALASKPIDANGAEAAIRAISTGHVDIEVAQIRAIAQAEAILTAEQREKFRSLTAGSHCPGMGQIS